MTTTAAQIKANPERAAEERDERIQTIQNLTGALAPFASAGRGVRIAAKETKHGDSMIRGITQNGNNIMVDLTNGDGFVLRLQDLMVAASNLQGG